KPDPAAVEKSHLRRCGKEKRNAKRIPVKGDPCIKVSDGDEQLSNLCICEIHINPLGQMLWRLTLELSGGAAVRLERVVSHYPGQDYEATNRKTLVAQLGRLAQCPGRYRRYKLNPA